MADKIIVSDRYGREVALTPVEFAKFIEKIQREKSQANPVVKTQTCRACAKQLHRRNRAKLFIAIRKFEKAEQRGFAFRQISTGQLFCKSCAYSTPRYAIGDMMKHLLTEHEQGEWYYPQYCVTDWAKMTVTDRLIIERGVDVISSTQMKIGAQSPPSGNPNSEGIKRAQEKERQAKPRDLRPATPEEIKLIIKEYKRTHKDVKTTDKKGKRVD